MSVVALGSVEPAACARAGASSTLDRQQGVLIGESTVTHPAARVAQPAPAGDAAPVAERPIGWQTSCNGSPRKASRERLNDPHAVSGSLRRDMWITDTGSARGDVCSSVRRPRALDSTSRHRRAVHPGDPRREGHADGVRASANAERRHHRAQARQPDADRSAGQESDRRWRGPRSGGLAGRALRVDGVPPRRGACRHPAPGALGRPQAVCRLRVQRRVPGRDLHLHDSGGLRQPDARAA